MYEHPKKQHSLYEKGFHWTLNMLHKPVSFVLKNTVGTITHVTTKESVVALTFDDGPDSNYTPRLLDILQRHNAHATFFCVGKAAELHPQIVRRTAEAGHAIGNHSWDHPSFPTISRRERRRQIQMCQEVLRPYGGQLFRPPFGHQNIRSHIDVVHLGYQVIAWNSVGYDWLDHDAAWITEYLAHEIQPGNIIALHDGLFTTSDARYCDRQPVLEAVDATLERFGRQFRFVTVPDLLLCGRPHRMHWHRKGDAQWLKAQKTPSEPQAGLGPEPKHPTETVSATRLRAWSKGSTEGGGKVEQYPAVVSTANASNSKNHCEKNP
jgi:peptidoglycan/xylan/chitin deacetylase (PgdA/CDA1 family)